MLFEVLLGFDRIVCYLFIPLFNFEARWNLRRLTLIVWILNTYTSPLWLDSAHYLIKLVCWVPCRYANNSYGRLLTSQCGYYQNRKEKIRAPVKIMWKMGPGVGNIRVRGKNYADPPIIPFLLCNFYSGPSWILWARGIPFFYPVSLIEIKRFAFLS